MPEKNINEKVIEILSHHQSIVWPEIEKLLKDPPYPVYFSIPKSYSIDVKKIWSITNDYPQRKGKYLRPTLLLLTNEALGGNLKKALFTACAMQISEEWLLIHDDIEDDSDVRRKKPTLHKLHGIEHAINAGDILHVIMWRFLAENIKVLGKKKAFAVLEEFYKMLIRTAIGQGIEISWSKSKKFDIKDKDWFFIADGKTSYYTIAGPMRLAGIINGLGTSQLAKITKFGKIMGRCFQLVDDLLDLTQKEYKGKGHILGSDLYEGKKTLILGHLVRNASQKDLKRIKAILTKPRNKKQKEEIEWILKKMYEYKSIDYAKRVALNLQKKALRIFEKDLKFLKEEAARKKLKLIIQFIVEREY